MTVLWRGLELCSRSAIEWTETTWNLTTGCDQVSTECDNCYALSFTKRLKATGQAKYQRDGDLGQAVPVAGSPSTPMS